MQAGSGAWGLWLWQLHALPMDPPQASLQSTGGAGAGQVLVVNGVPVDAGAAGAAPTLAGVAESEL